jgi:hypothetical protein
MTNELSYAVLSMDAYNRGGGARLYLRAVLSLDRGVALSRGTDT